MAVLLRRRKRSRAASGLRGCEGAQILEFAIALPLLAVFLVGIFDFGQALNFKQELNNAAREGARLGSMQPTNDLTNSVPDSVKAIRDVVDSYLTAAGIEDCGLGAPSNSGTLTWTATGNTNCGGGTITLTINRGFATPATVDGTTINVICTRVSITYPFQWRLDKMIQFVVPGASYTTSIGTDATMPNMD